MKVFLFLYPISWYIDNLVTDWLVKRGLPGNLNRLNQIIDFRYRQRDHKIFWAVPGQERKAFEPDLQSISKLIDIRKEDQVVSCGLACSQFTRDCDQSSYIFSQLPSTISCLTVGGYHQWDCVDWMARFAYEKKILLEADEDTTELYYHMIYPSGIPNERRHTLKEMGLNTEGPLFQFIIKPRLESPWFTHE